MKTRTWPYGTVKHVIVEKSDPAFIVVTEEATGEGYVLAFHGLSKLPEHGSHGIITFTKGGPTGGYWAFTAPDSETAYHSQNSTSPTST